MYIGKLESRSLTPFSSSNPNDRYEIDVKEPVPSTSKVEPILGHVSLLTTALITRNGKRIITGDRDEHIRISEFPCGWNIETYLGGHSRLVEYFESLRFFSF